MTDRQRPEFIENALNAYAVKLDKAAADGAAQRKKEFIMMFNAMREILGESAEIIAADGHETQINDMHCWIWGNLAFNPITGWNCSVKPQFRFAICDISQQEAIAVGGWHIVDDLEDMGRYIKQGQVSLEGHLKRRAAARIVKRDFRADRFAKIATSFREETNGSVENLMLAILEFMDSFNGEYHDDDDDEDYEQD